MRRNASVGYKALMNSDTIGNGIGNIGKIGDGKGIGNST